MWLRSCLSVLVAVHLACIGQLTWANEVDEEGNLIATPREAAMMQRGFLFYPPRVVRKAGTEKPSSQGALVSPSKDKSGSNNSLIQAVVTPVPQPTLAPKAASPEPVAAAPAPSIADEMVKVDPPSDAPAAPAPPAIDKILQADSQKRMSAPERASKITAYAGSGTSVVVGLNMPSDGGLNYRVEYSDGFQSVTGSKTYGGGKYTESNTQQRLGLFVDWSPGHNNWAVTGGLTLNDHKFHFQSKKDAGIFINGKAFTGESISIDYSLPILTPYVGVRYASKAINDKGWEGFVELGAVLSRLNAEAQIIDSSPAYAESDVRSEMDTVRKSIYKWGVVPNALVGLSYRY